MSICYAYLNFDREEYFSAGALGGGMKIRSLGRGLEGRALGLLLMEGATPTDGRIDRGAWAGNRVIAAGDGDEPSNIVGVFTEEDHTLYQHARKHYRDVLADIALMMLVHERNALLEAAGHHDGVFMLLGELAQVHRCENVARALQEHFGKDWLKSYGRKLESAKR